MKNTIIEKGTRKSEIKLDLDNQYFVMNTRDGNATLAFPHKFYKTLSSATKYANKFINA